MNHSLQTEIQSKIFFIRGVRVILDFHLAEFFQLSTKRFNEQIKRHSKKFPDDFVFELSREEWILITSHTELLKTQHGGRRSLPLAFTEYGVAMLACALDSDEAIKMNISIIRSFIEMKNMMMDHKDLLIKLEQLENKYDEQFKIVFEALRSLLPPSETRPKTKIGLVSNKK